MKPIQSDHAGAAGDDHSQRRPGARRDEPLARALVERFRSALAQSDSAQAQPGDSPDNTEAVSGEPTRERQEFAASDGRGRGVVPGEADNWPEFDAQALANSTHPQTMTTAGSVPQAAAAAAHNGAVFADLLEKHVRQLLVSQRRAFGTDDAKVMLSLTDVALPGTLLTLTQTAEGWLLESNSTSMDSYRVIRELAPDLEQRFAASRLGAIEVRANLSDER